MDPARYKEKKCDVCGDKFYVSRRRLRGRRPLGIRPMRSVTCSKRCSLRLREVRLKQGKWMGKKGNINIMTKKNA